MAGAAAPPARTVAVWDLPLRLFHWALVALVVFSYATAKVGGEWMEWHLRSGYALLTLLLFRLAWGLVGSQTARFAAFLRGPVAAARYLRGLPARDHPRIAGHNPAGGWMVVAMLAILLVQAASGLFTDDEIFTQGPLAVKVSNATVGRMSAVHSFNEWLLVGAVALHVAAIAGYQWLLRIDIVGPMVHGRMPVDRDAPAPRLRSPWLALALLASAVGVVYWLVVIFPRVPG